MGGQRIEMEALDVVDYTFFRHSSHTSTSFTLARLLLASGFRSGRR